MIVSSHVVAYTEKTIIPIILNTIMLVFAKKKFFKFFNDRLIGRWFFLLCGYDNNYQEYKITLIHCFPGYRTQVRLKFVLLFLKAL